MLTVDNRTLTKDGFNSNSDWLVAYVCASACVNWRYDNLTCDYITIRQIFAIIQSSRMHVLTLRKYKRKRKCVYGANMHRGFPPSLSLSLTVLVSVCVCAKVCFFFRFNSTKWTQKPRNWINRSIPIIFQIGYYDTKNKTLIFNKAQRWIAW